MMLQFIVSTYPGAVILLLITGIAAILFGLFMLLDFLKNKKIYHLLWALAFIVLFVAGVVLIFSNDYSLLLSPLVAALAVLIPGGIAAGLYYAVFEDKKLVGHIFLIFVLVMIILVGIAKASASPGASATVMVAHIPSSLSIILLPLYTTFKTKKTDWKALLMSIGGLVVSLAGVLLALFTINPTDIPLLILILTVLPIVLLITAVFFALGMLLPDLWSFAIPGLKKKV
ncbi:MAG: hypothetical protein HWN80_15090 [Candidatus Lokiarchaeota archaeon]|nr:hypothetical protein [Candidatus Lokiarchaeota archaeon]